MTNYIFRTCSCCKLRWQKVKFREITYRKVINCLDLNQLSLFFGRSSKLCHCHNFCQITQNVNCLRDLESFDVVRGLSSWGVSREEFQPQKPEPWGIRALKTWTPEEFQLENPYLNPWGIPASKTWTTEESQPQKHEPVRNSSLKNIDPPGIPASTVALEETRFKNINPPAW